MLKTCKSCCIDKPLSDFYPHKKSKGGFLARCKSCVSQQRKENYDKEIALGHTLKSKYGITLDQYKALLAKQDHKCAICHTSNPGDYHGRFCVDHDHNTSRVRGLLCHNCNSALGNFYDSVTNLLSAVKYLQSANDPPASVA